MSASLNGLLCLWRGDWLFVGAPQANRPHRHVAASLLCGLQAPFELDIRGERRLTRLALVAPEVPQALTPGAGRMLIAHLDPDTEAWRQLAGHLAEGRDSVDLPLQPEWSLMAEALMASPADRALADALRSALLNKLGCPAAPLDPRILRVAAHLRATMPDRLDASELAALTGLSASRLIRLFREQSGVTLRRFLLHLKTMQLFHHWRQGMTVSALAAASGFYDQPHLVRTTREMFDALPSQYMTGGFSVLDCARA